MATIKILITILKIFTTLLLITNLAIAQTSNVEPTLKLSTSEIIESINNDFQEITNSINEFISTHHDLQTLLPRLNELKDFFSLEYRTKFGTYLFKLLRDESHVTLEGNNRGEFTYKNTQILFQKKVSDLVEINSKFTQLLNEFELLFGDLMPSLEPHHQEYLKLVNFLQVKSDHIISILKINLKSEYNIDYSRPYITMSNSDYIPPYLGNADSTIDKSVQITKAEYVQTYQSDQPLEPLQIKNLFSLEQYLSDQIQFSLSNKDTPQGNIWKYNKFDFDIESAPAESGSSEYLYFKNAKERGLSDVGLIANATGNFEKVLSIMQRGTKGMGYLNLINSKQISIHFNDYQFNYFDSNNYKLNLNKSKGFYLLIHGLWEEVEKNLTAKSVYQAQRIELPLNQDFFTIENGVAILKKGTHKISVPAYPMDKRTSVEVTYDNSKLQFKITINDTYTYHDTQTHIDSETSDFTEQIITIEVDPSLTKFGNIKVETQESRGLPYSTNKRYVTETTSNLKLYKPISLKSSSILKYSKAPPNISAEDIPELSTSEAPYFIKLIDLFKKNNQLLPTTTVSNVITSLNFRSKNLYCDKLFKN